MFKRALLPLLFTLLLVGIINAEGVVRLKWVDTPKHQGNDVIGWIEIKVPSNNTGTNFIPGRMRLKRDAIVAYHISFNEHQIRSKDKDRSFLTVISEEEYPLILDRGKLYLNSADKTGIKFHHLFEQQIPRANRFIDVNKFGFIDSGARQRIEYQVTTGFIDAGTSYDHFRAVSANPMPRGIANPAVLIGTDARYMGQYVPPTPEPEPDPSDVKLQNLLDDLQALIDAYSE